MPLKEIIKNHFNNKKTLITFIIGLLTFLIFSIASAFAYFSVNSTNSTTVTTSTGALKSIGNVSLVTNTSKLYLNLNSVVMNNNHIGNKYFATTASTGTYIESSTVATGQAGKYNLATASVASGETLYDCNYSYDITATVTKPIKDGSDNDIKVVFASDSISGGYITYTLNQILAATQTLTGTFQSLGYGEPQTITIESYMENTAKVQNDYSGNGYTIKVTPKAGTSGFSCSVASTLSSTLASRLIQRGNMWQSGLEGDDFRFVGDIYNQPHNYICFGTINKTDCTNDPYKYLYRIIGVFKDASNQPHVKLIKYSQINSRAWNTTNADVNWGNSTMNAGLNGSYFLTNTNYSYMQSSTWTDKITDWTWTAVNTELYSRNGLNYGTSTTMKNIYLHEMNRGTKSSTIGTWTTNTNKIGLMYVSDYALSLGSESLNYYSETNKKRLKEGWIHQYSNSNPNSIAYDLTIARFGSYSTNWYSWVLFPEGTIWGGGRYVSTTNGYRPVFYLNNNVTYKSGTGTFTDPFIIN